MIKTKQKLSFMSIFNIWGKNCFKEYFELASHLTRYIFVKNQQQKRQGTTNYISNF